MEPVWQELIKGFMGLIFMGFGIFFLFSYKLTPLGIVMVACGMFIALYVPRGYLFWWTG